MNNKDKVFCNEYFCLTQVANAAWHSYRLALVVVVVFFFSCTETTNKDTEKKYYEQSDSVVKLLEDEIDSIENNKHDAIEKSRKGYREGYKEGYSIEDDESVYQFRYEFYINKAYDKKTYEKHYKPYTYQSEHLDSLIRLYDKNRKVEDSLKMDN